MARQYRLGLVRRAANVFIRAFLVLRIPPPHTYLLGVRGRKTGVLRTTPVRLVEERGRRWLVAPYGEVNWVLNFRASGDVQLKRRRGWQRVRLIELPPKEAAPILKTYLTQVAIVRPFFDVSPKSSLAEFEREAPRHPVFEILSGSNR